MEDIIIAISFSIPSHPFSFIIFSTSLNTRGSMITHLLFGKIFARKLENITKRLSDERIIAKEIF